MFIPTDFHQRCYDLLKQVPCGRVTTYKDIALALGSNAYRAVGQAMACNPYVPEVPCHRVVRSDGDINGYAKGNAAKIALLEKEGVQVRNNKVVGFKQKRYCFF